MLRKMRNKKGFTLIELIVVIAILAILALIAIPKLSGFTSSAKVNADYATAATIGHAAQAYLVDHPQTSGTIDLSTLTGAGMLPGTTKVAAQSSGNNWLINVSGGDVTVKDGSSGTTFYPHN